MPGKNMWTTIWSGDPSTSVETVDQVLREYAIRQFNKYADIHTDMDMRVIEIHIQPVAYRAGK